MGVRLTREESRTLYEALLGKNASKDQIREAILATASAKEQLPEQRAG